MQFPRKSFFCVLIIAVLSLTGCVAFREAERIFSDKLSGEDLRASAEKPLSEVSQTGFDYTLLVEQSGIAPAKYEPIAGCYLGADMSRDARTGDILAFDRLSGMGHAISAVEITLDGEIPLVTILTAHAAQKAVLLTIRPPKAGDVFDEAQLSRVCGELSRYSIPLFINFYPYSGALNVSAQSYKAFFRKAWLAFWENVPNAAMVWSTSCWDVEKSAEYYPGSNYADWVGLSITASVNQQGEYEDFIPLFEAFCKTYQEDKPIMISSLSLSHFSTIDNAYSIDLCAETITGFYGGISAKWPRVKAVVYNSFNELSEQKVKYKARNNYMITGNERILGAYRAAAGTNWFLASVSAEPVKNPDEYRQLLTHTSAGVLQNNTLYISEHAANDMDIPLGQARKTRVQGENSYQADALASGSKRSVYVDTDNSVAYMFIK